MSESTTVEQPTIDVENERSRRGQLTWELARMYPRQGEWTEEEYLRVAELTTDRIELVDGCLEFLPMGSMLHAFLVRSFLVSLIDHCSKQTPGFEPFTAPLPTRLCKGEYRDPDVLLVRSESARGSLRRQPVAADVAMVLEFVSPGDEARERDYETKTQVYAEAGIDEYWIVDPDELRIVVHTLDGNTYRVHGEFGRDTTATSVLLPGFEVDVTALFTAAGEIGSPDEPTNN